MANPAISVVMAVYNGERYLAEAVDSILNQTFSDFEFIIIDDASQDNTPAILEKYHDSRIVRLKNDTNAGLSASLNHGIEVARGSYVARMDADDISHPERLDRQYNRLVVDPELDVLGTAYVEITNQGLIIEEASPPTTHSLIVWNLLLHNVMAHPSIMMRRDAVLTIGGYNPAFRLSQDYELWTRLALKGRFANLPERLLKHRVPDRFPSSRKIRTQETVARKAQRNYFCALLGRDVPIEQIEWIFQSSKVLVQRNRKTLSQDQGKVVVALLLEAFEAMQTQGIIRADEKDEVRHNLVKHIVTVGQCTVPAWYWKMRAFASNPYHYVQHIRHKLQTRQY